MPEIFRRKKFSYYLGEQRALDDIVVGYTASINPTPTPTPSITPSTTPTGTPNPTATPTTTSTPTSTSVPAITPTSTTTPTTTPTNTTTPTTTPTFTPTPTKTPNALCPQQLILSASSPSYLYGLYSRATIYTGGTFETAWYNFDDNVMNYGTNPDGNDYVAYRINSGSDYTSLYWSSDIMGNDGNWTIGYSTGNTLFNGGTLINAAVLDPNSLVSGSLFYPPSGFLQYNGGYINYPAICPTPTPTSSPASTATPTPTLTPTPTSTPIAIQAEYTAILNRAAALGLSVPSTTERYKQNQLVYDLKTAGLWTKLGTFYMFKVDTTFASPAFTFIDWIEPTSVGASLGVITGTTFPTHLTNSGWTFTRANNINTGQNIGTGTNPISATIGTGNTMGVYYVQNITGSSSGANIIWQTNNNGWNYARYNITTSHALYRGTILTTQYDFTGLGFKATTIQGVISADTQVVFTNGSVQTIRNKGGADTGVAGNSLFINGASAPEAHAWTVGCYFAGGGQTGNGISSGDTLTLSTIITNYMTSP